VDECLDAALPVPSTRPTRLHEAMRYSVLNGGKRVRPLLVYAAGECLGVDAATLDAPAVAIELIHAFSLVHDDLPAMDDDDLRRGEPTVHIKFDEATAILAADALQPLAFSVLSGLEGVPAKAKIDLVRLIADACGSTGMTGGQSIDLAAEGGSLSAAALEHMYSLKTGALIHASVMSACVLRDDLCGSRAREIDAPLWQSRPRDRRIRSCHRRRFSDQRRYSGCRRRNQRDRQTGRLRSTTRKGNLSGPVRTRRVATTLR
jgi:farnesyl diphosphate synthase